MAELETVYGLHAVQALLKSAPQRARELWVVQGRRDQRLKKVLQLAELHGIAQKTVSRRELDACAGGSHQGVALRAEAGPLFDERYLLSLIEDRQSVPVPDSAVHAVPVPESDTVPVPKSGHTVPVPESLESNTVPVPKSGRHTVPVPQTETVPVPQTETVPVPQPVPQPAPDTVPVPQPVPQPAPFLLVLDGVTDPHNLGACLRSAEAAGVDAVVVPKDNSAGINATVRKVACGAAEVLPLIPVTNLARTLKALQERGLWVIGAAGEAERTLYEADLKGPLVLVLGAEGKGLRRLTREVCDGLVKLPMAGTVSSLNVSVAAGVCLFEAVRQRGIASA